MAKSKLDEVFGKNRYWEAICYPENMDPDWQKKIDRTVQLPVACCFHNLDLDKEGDHRTPHWHVIIAFPNTTTHSHAKEVALRLSAPGKKCLSTIEPCYSIRGSYDYLIHDTEAAISAGKHLYPKEDRLLFNGFDIGAYEQFDEADKSRMFDSLCFFIINNRIDNFAVFVSRAYEDYGGDDLDLFRTVLKGSGALLHRLCQGNYQLISKRRSNNENQE